MILLYCGLATAVFVLSLSGTMMIARHSAKFGLINSPNARSSHTVPTPRGGGAAIAVTTGCGALVLTPRDPALMWPAVGFVTLLAGLGLVDDLRDLKPIIRFGIQAMAIAGFLLVVRDLPVIPVTNFLWIGGTGLLVLTTVSGIWWINLFNFMDGIDGIAASQAIAISLSAAFLLMIKDPNATNGATFWFAILVCAASAGFLMRNWPPAKIFMGDAGSYFLASAIFAIAVLTLVGGQLGYPAWLILVSAFVTDATVTLVRRLARGERPWAAHRRHGYQQASRRWGHRNVTVAFSVLSFGWTLPLALLTATQPHLQWLIVALAYLPLTALAIIAGSGAATER